VEQLHRFDAQRPALAPGTRDLGNGDGVFPADALKNHASG
jgi:hypothetical protein